MTVCRLRSVRDATVEVQGLDLIDGTPVLDIKPYIAAYDSEPGGNAAGLGAGLSACRRSVARARARAGDAACATRSPAALAYRPANGLWFALLYLAGFVVPDGIEEGDRP